MTWGYFISRLKEAFYELGLLYFMTERDLL